MKLSDTIPQRMKHDYTNEIELKSLLIREKNNKLNPELSTENNDLINDLIKEYTKEKSPELKTKIIELSEKTKIDDNSHNIFGKIVLLMIKKILTKPNFSGYSWHDEFYSDACFRVFKYLHNFDHTKVSEINNQEVSAFAYISQIIHNSILFIIGLKNKQTEFNNSLIREHNDVYDIERETLNSSSYESEHQKPVIEYKINNISEIFKLNFDEDYIYNIKYPKKLIISYDEYYEIKNYLNQNRAIINITKSK